MASVSDPLAPEKLPGQTDQPRRPRNVAEISAEVLAELMDEIREAVQAHRIKLEDVRHNKGELAPLLDALRRDSLRLRGLANSLGAPAVGVVLYRLQDYLANVRGEVPKRFYDDIGIFLDQLLDMADSPVDTEYDTSSIARSMPVKVSWDFDVADIQVRDLEVLLVMSHGAAAHFVERELQQCGYRTYIVPHTLDAIATVVRTKPDFVIVSAVMEELSGIDLTIALSHMPETRNIPCALITSLDANDDHLKLLPDRVPVIHKGKSFADDLLNALQDSFLM